MLLPVSPFALVDLSRGVDEPTFPMFFAMLVFSCVLRTIAPREGTSSVELSVEPLSFVVGVIAVPGDAPPFRHEAVEVDLPLVLPAFFVGYFCFILGVVVQAYSIG